MYKYLWTYTNYIYIYIFTVYIYIYICKKDLTHNCRSIEIVWKLFYKRPFFELRFQTIIFILYFLFRSLTKWRRTKPPQCLLRLTSTNLSCVLMATVVFFSLILFTGPKQEEAKVRAPASCPARAVRTFTGSNSGALEHPVKKKQFWVTTHHYNWGSFTFTCVRF